MNIRFIIQLFCIVLLLVTMSSCSSKKNQPTHHTGKQIVAVTKQKQASTLFFTGTIKPIEIVNIPAPVDGVVDKLYFHYGQKVSKDELLVTVRSPKLMQDYQEAFTSFLKAKDAYLSKKSNLEGTEELFKADLIPRNTYEEQKSQLADAYLTYTNAKRHLENIVGSTKDFVQQDIDLESLTLEDTEAVQRALNVQLEELHIHSPTFGIILMPDKENGDSSAKLLKVGGEVKQNSTLISIGDFTGLALKVNVSEIDINNVAPGQKVKVTGVAFPDVLEGYVSSVDVQATTGDNGSLPSFPVDIVVSYLNEKQRHSIHIGMSAQVELIIEKPAVLTVPIKAVFQNGNQNMVNKIVDNKSGKTEAVPIVTGSSNADTVIVEKGLQEGDQVLVND